MEWKFQNKSGFLPPFSPNARTARRSAAPFRPSRPYPCSLHSKCGSVLSPPAAALALPVRQPPPNRADAASGALRVFSGTHWQGPGAGRSGRNVKTARRLRGQAARQTETGRTSAHPSMSATSLYVPPRFRKRNRSVLPKSLFAGRCPSKVF